MIKLLLSLLLLIGTAQAAIVDLGAPYANGGTVTASNLNGKFTAITAQVNGGLDNDNANATQGFRFFETKSSLPTNGNQGRVVFLTTNNTLNFDNGSSWQTTVTPSGTPSTGYFPYYNSGWTLLAPGSQYYSLVSNGVSSLPSYQQISLTNGVTSTLPIANGGTGQTTAQAAVDALLPSQASASGKFLTSNGSASSWSATGQGMTLISTTSVAAANTSNIAISATKQYMVLASVTYSSGNITAIQFNADTGNTYSYLYNGRTTGGALTGGATATSMIQTGTAPLANTQVNMLFYIYPQNGTQVQTHGHISYVNSAASLLSFTDFAGYWDNSAAITSFRLISQGGGTITGTVYLYAINQS